MIGDMIVLYNTATGKFFAGWRYGVRTYDGDKMPPVWTDNADEAKRTSDLRAAHRVKDEIGPNVRLMSTTRARQISEARAYREAMAK